MIGTWLAKSGRKQETRRETFVPRVEGLEDRLVPAAAISLVPGFTSHTLAAGHNKTAAANIGFSIDFYGKTYSSLFVNTSGNVTLSSGLTSFIPPFTGGFFPTSLGQGVIAPFWADVDNTGAGTITYGTGTLDGYQAFAVTWSGVGYATAQTTPIDSFQMILIDRPDTGAGNFDLEFNYNSIAWDSSQTMNGVAGLATGHPTAHAASVAFTAGTGAPGTFFILPGSNAAASDPFTDTGSLSLMNHDLNSNIKGRYNFYFRNGALTNGVPTNVAVYEPFRYVFNAASQTFTGNLTLVNRSPSIQSVVNPQASLGELLPSSQTTGPVAVVFTNLPPGVTLTNKTGTTGSGHPYITVSTTGFGPGATLRIALSFRDPLLEPLPNFFDSKGVEVFLGGFNPGSV